MDYFAEGDQHQTPIHATSSKSSSTMSRVLSLSALEATNRLEMDEIRERLCCLVEQEKKNYLCSDYITPQANNNIETNNNVVQVAKVVADLAMFTDTDDITPTGVNKSPSAVCVRDLAPDTTTNNSTSSSFVRDGESADASVVGFWRQQMLNWSNVVIDSFGIDREVVAVGFNILDRYVGKEVQSGVPITREDFQLFCMTSLYIAVKILESYPRKLTADALVEMSRGFYAGEDILHTEREILKVLGWYLSPTTAIGYCRIFWDMIPVPVTHEFQTNCQVLAELALGDPYFLTKKPSMVALAAVLLSGRMEGMQNSVMSGFRDELPERMRADCNTEEFEAVFQRLEYLCSSNNN